MNKRRVVFPMEVQSGSVIVKIYKVQNKGRDSDRMNKRNPFRVSEMQQPAAPQFDPGI